MAPEKGSSYDKTFSLIPFRAFLWQMERDFLDSILKRHFTGREIRHLDFACGTGRVVGYLEDRVEASVGLDISESMLSVARENVKASELIEGDITMADPLTGRLFNLITAFRFFPNAEPALRAQVLEGLKEHLEPDGLIVFNNHRNFSSTLYRFLRFYHLIRHFVRSPRVGMSQGEVDALLASTGFEIVEVHHVGVLIADDRHLLLAPLWRACERLASRIGALRGLSQNLIFVVRKRV
jgi:predicted TPR repeat methyltransferase